MRTLILIAAIVMVMVPVTVSACPAHQANGDISNWLESEFGSGQGGFKHWVVEPDHYTIVVEAPDGSRVEFGHGYSREGYVDGAKDLIGDWFGKGLAPQNDDYAG